MAQRPYGDRMDLVCWFSVPQLRQIVSTTYSVPEILK